MTRGWSWMSPRPWHISIAFLASFPQDPCCDTLVSSQHFPPWLLIREAEDAAFKKGKRKKSQKTKPTSRKGWLKLNTESELHFEFLVHVLAYKKGLSYSSPKFHLLESSTVLCTTGKCHCKIALFKIIFSSRCSHSPFSWVMMHKRAQQFFLAACEICCAVCTGT